MNKLGNLACLTKQNVSYFLKDFFGWGNQKVGGQKIARTQKKKRRQKKFSFPSCIFGWSDGKLFYLVGEKIKWEDGKYNLYKLTHMSLLKI